MLYVKLSKICENYLTFILLITHEDTNRWYCLVLWGYLPLWCAFQSSQAGHMVVTFLRACALPAGGAGTWLPPFVYCIYLPWARVSSALADLQSLESKKRVNSWSGNLNIIWGLSGLQWVDAMSWNLCTVLTRYCLLPAVIVWFPEAHEFNGWCLGYDTGVVCLSVWLALGIGSCDQAWTPATGWKMQTMFWFWLCTASATFQCLLMLI